jgi:hypothetical protein
MALIWALGALAGIGVGLWVASLTYACPFSCVSGVPRFAAWQSCLVGASVSVVIPALAIALDREFVPSTLQGYRTVSRFLFEDLRQQR